jgi:autotransporter-associated beta strand protein
LLQPPRTTFEEQTMFRLRNRVRGHRVCSAVAVLATVLALSHVPPAAAQYTWTGVVNGQWGNSGNWSPAGIPPSGPDQALTFGAAANTTMMAGNNGSAYQLNKMIFSAGGPVYSLSGNPLNFTNSSSSVSPSIVMDTDAVVTIGDALTLTNNLFVTGVGGGNLRLNGVVSGGGGLTYSGAGTLTLGSGSNTYTGGTVISSGTLALGAGGAPIPANTPVTVQAGATFDIAASGNGSATPMSNLILNGGTLRATGANNGACSIKALTMTGGLIDFASAPYVGIHVTTSAGITTNASSTPAVWDASNSALPRILNDSGSPMNITVAAGTTPSGIDLEAGIALSSAGLNPTFVKVGAGTMRLTNTGNTADIALNQGRLRVDNVTNGTGALGFGAISVGAATLQYGGPTDALTKNLTISGNAAIQVLNDGTNLTYSGTINQSGVQPFRAYGPFTTGTSSTLTFTGNNSYSGSTTVDGNAVLSIPTIANGGAASPIGASSNAAGNLVLGGPTFRGTLLLTGTNASYSTDRGATFGAGGGAIGVQNAGTNLTMSGQLTGGKLVKTGDGSLEVAATMANNYTGGTYVEGGTLRIDFVLPPVDGLPANGNVTISAGAAFEFGQSGKTIGTLTINGGATRFLGAVSNSLGGLVMTGGSLELIDSANLTYSGNTITVNRSSTAAVWIGNGSSAAFSNYSGGPLTMNVNSGSTPANIDLDIAGVHLGWGPSDAERTYTKIGAGTIRVAGGNNNHWLVQQGALRVDDMSSLTVGNITLNGGRLAWGGADATLGKSIFVDSAGGGFDVINASTTLTLTSSLSGLGAISKFGAGVLILNNLANQFAGGLIVNGGRIDVSDDAQLGAASPTVNPAGTLRYTVDSTASRTFNLNGGKLEAAAGVTLTLNGAAINGGFLRGAGTFALTGGTTLTGATTLNSTTLNQTGSANYVDFSHGGTLTVAPGLATPTTFDGFTNHGSGSITVGATSAVYLADFQSYGTLTINPAMITQTYANTTLLTNTGTSPLSFNGGSRTFVGTPATAVFPSNWPDVSLRGTPTFVAGIDLNGKNAVVAGGLFVNNGYVEDSSNSYQGTATVIADFGALVKGAGFFQNSVVTQNGGKFQAGNSPGRATFGRFVLGPGGVTNYVFAIDDATGTSGPSPDAAGHVSGWGFVKSVSRQIGVSTTPGDFEWTATPADKLLVSLETLLNLTTVGLDVSGPMDHFDPNRSYFWPAVEWSGRYAGPMDATALLAATAFDTNEFRNPIAGTFGWALDTANHSLSLTYTPTAVPEPGTMLFTGLAAIGLAWRRRRSVLVLSATVVLAVVGPAAAQWTWTGATSGLWGDSTNWSPMSIPLSTQSTTLTFGAAANTAMTAGNNGTPFQLNQMNFSAGGPAYTVNGNPLNFTNNSAAVSPTIVMDTSNAVTIADPLILTNNLSVSGAGAGALTLNGVLSGGGGLTCAGAGTVILGGGSNTYSGGTQVLGGTLALSTGNEIPTNGFVYVESGGQLNIGSGGNSAATAIGTLELAGGTFRVPSGSGDYYLNGLQMHGSMMDFTGTSNFYLHFRNASASMSILPDATTATWKNDGPSSFSRIQNDTGSPMNITVAAGATASGIDLDAGIILSSGGTNATFVKLGAGTMRLTNPGNTANVSVNQGALRIDDVTALGTGVITVGAATLQYGGMTATLTKNLIIAGNMAIHVLNDGVNLTFAGTINSSGGTLPFRVYGPFVAGTSSMLTITGTQNYTGSTTVDGNGILAVTTIGNAGPAGNPGPLGSSSNAASNLLLGSGGYRGTLLLTGTGANYSCDRGVTLPATGGSGVYPAGGAIGVDSPATNLTWTGQIIGNSAFAKTGPGTLTLTNTASTYYQGTYIEAGTLAVGAAGPVIPATTDVTVFAGGTFQIGPAANNAGNSIRTVTLSGGALAASAGSGSYDITKLAMTGGTVDFSAAVGFRLRFVNSTAGITINAGPTATWIGSSSRFENYTNAPLPITVASSPTNGGIDLDAGVALNPGSTSAFLKTGPGTMRLTNPGNHADFIVQKGALRIDDLTGGVGPLGTGALTLGGGRLAYGGPDATLSKPFTVDTSGGTLDVLSAATTMTVTSPVTSNGVLTKAGPGVLVLNNLANQYDSGLVVSGGRLDVSDDAQLGLANPTVNAFGTLRYTASMTTARTFALNSGALEAGAGVTLTLNGAGVGGGFLRGAGTFAVTGGTTFSGTTTFTSTTISQIGPGAYTNFANGGALKIAADASGPITMNGFSNEGSGSITVGARAAVALGDFQTYGTLTVSPANLTQTFAETTLMTNTGTTPLSFNGGSRTFIGTPQTAVFPNNWPDVSLRGTPTFVAGIDLNGKNAVVAGGLFVNNGYVEDSSNNFAGTATIVADFGALVKGAGFFQNSVQTINGGKFQAGNSPGLASFGRFVLGPGGVSSYLFAIDDATGAAGPSPDVNGHVSGWGLVKVTGGTPVPPKSSGDFTWTATAADKLVVSLETLLNPTTVGMDVPGMMDHFDPTRAYQWPAVEWMGSYFGPSDVSVLNASTSFETTGFLNPIAGSFGWSLDQSGHMLALTYTPSVVPEPGTLALVGFAAIGAWWRHWRSRRNLHHVFAAGVFGVVAWSAPPAAAQYTWNPANTAGWNSGFNWAPFGIGVPNSPNATVTFGNTTVAGLSVSISSSVQAQSLTFSNTTGGYTLTSTPNQTLSALSGINVDAAVTGLQTINLANVSTGSLLFPAGSNLTVANNSTASAATLVIGPNTVIGTPGSGAVTVTGSGVTTISGSFAPGLSQVVGGLSTAGTGSLFVSGNGANLFGGTSLNSGFLYWDYRTNTASKLGGGDLVLADGAFSLLPNAVTAVTQTVPSGNTIVSTGDTLLLAGSAASHANITLSLGTLTRVTTGTVDIVRDANSAVTTTTGLTNGILGGWAAVNTSSWATKSGSSIVPLTSFGTDVYTPGVNSDVTTGSSIPTGFTTNTLRFNTPVTAVLSGTNTVQTGGILVSAAGDQSTISGGTLTSGTGELIVHAFSRLTINSSLSLASGLTQTGGAALTLGGQTNWPGGAPLTINYGSVIFTNPLAFDTLATVRFNNHTDYDQALGFQLPDGQDATCSAAISLTGHATFDLNNFNQIQNYAANSRITLSGVISSGGGASSVFFSGASESSGFNLTGANTFTGNVLVASGVLGITSDGSLGNAANKLTLTNTALNNAGLEFLNDGTSLLHALQIHNAGRIIVGGSNSNSINSAIAGDGSLIKFGTGTLILNNAANTYIGGTTVSEGRLTLGVGAAIPTGTNVTVSTGAEFNTGGLSNTPATVIGTLTLNGGTFRVPSGAGDYYVNSLATGPTGGTVDFSGSSNFWLHLTGAGASITVNGDSTWTGAPGSHIQNDNASPIDIRVTNYPFAKLTNGIILANGTQNQGFRLTGAPGLVSVMELTSLGNTADLIADSTGYIRVADMAYLGSGSLTLQNTANDYRPGTLWYTGPTANSSKPITLGVGGGHIYVLTPGANLTLSGIIGEPAASPGQSLQVSGAFSAPSTLTLTGDNTFTGPVIVQYLGIVSIGTIANGGTPSPLGASSSGPGNLVLGGGAIYGTGTLQYTGQTATTDRGMTLGFYSGSVDVTDPATNLAFTGQFTGIGGLTKTGPGTLTLGGATDNYAGQTLVSSGRLALGSGTAIPPGGNVSVLSGAIFDTGGLGNDLGTAIGAMTLDGGTLRVPSGSTYYLANKLAVTSSGGTIDLTGATGLTGLVLANAGAAITVNANSTWTGPVTSLFANGSNAELPITIAPGVTLTSDLSPAIYGALSTNAMRLTGGGTLYLTHAPQYVAILTVDRSRLRLDDLTNVGPMFALTLDAGRLAYGGPTATSAATFALSAGGGTVEIVNAATTLTLSGTIFGTATGTLTKSGPGTLALTNLSNSYLGGLIINAGRLDVSADAQLGLADPTVNPAGTLRYTTSATTARTFNLNGGTLEAAPGVTLTLNGAAVNGGFLRGSGTFAVTGGTNSSGTTTFSSTTISQTGPGAYTNFTNGGTLNIAADAAGPITLNGFSNEGSASITVGARSAVALTDFQTYGTLTVNPANLTQTFAETTVVTNTGTTPLSFNGGSRTFVGTPATAVFPNNWPNVGQRGTPTFVAGIDLNGRNAVVAGGLFVNNGYVVDSSNNYAGTATVIADFGALVKGAGFFQNSVVTQNGGRFQAGNSPGSATFGHFVLGPGGVSHYVFAIDDATGTAGPEPDAAGHVSGWGFVKAVSRKIGGSKSPGDFVWTATPVDKLLVSLETLLNPTTVGVDLPGPMDHFDPSRSYVWPAVDWSGGYAGPTESKALDAATTFDTTGFVNPAAGTFGWSLDAADHTLSLTYTPTAVPEPGTAGLLMASVLPWLAYQRRTRRRAA